MTAENKQTEIQVLAKDNSKQLQILPSLKSVGALLLRDDVLIDRISGSVPNSIEKIMDAEPMCVLKHTVGMDKIQQLIEVELSKVTALMNVSNNMQPHQIIFTAEQIIETYPAESVDDIILCLRRGASGYYGSTYHQLDTSIILGWLVKHIEEKSFYLERNNLSGKKQEEESEVDYEAFKENLERRRNEKAEEVKKESERRKAMANDILFSKRKSWSVTVEDDNGIQKTWGGVYAPSQEVANDIVVKLIQSGQLKF